MRWLNALAKGAIIAYQKSFSLLGRGSCRYYPSCSEYARWCFESEGFLMACIHSVLRILRCNQLFAGGIDYPRVCRRLQRPATSSRKQVRYWWIPEPERPHCFRIVGHLTPRQDQPC